MTFLSSALRSSSTALLLTLMGCAPMTHAPDAPSPATDAPEAQADAPSVADAHLVDAAAQADAVVVNEDAPRIQYERDVRPVLEASRCGSCHAESAGVVMSYAWMSTAGTSWCSGDAYARRWSCFETHARTQTGDETTAHCSAFYHRHGEPCFSENERATVLAWAAGGFAE